MTLVCISSRELKYGIPVTDENGNRLGESPNAAKQAIVQVVVSRIGMAVPAMGNINIMFDCLQNQLSFFRILNDGCTFLVYYIENAL